MRLIPGKTKVRIELFKGVSLTDIAVGGIAVGFVVLVLASNLPGKLYISVGLAAVAVLLLFRLDSEPGYIYLLRIIKHLAFKKNLEKTVRDDVITGEKSRESMIEEIEKKEEKRPDPKQRKKQAKELKKQEDKILKSKTATKEEKDAVWLARANRSAANKKDKKQDKFDNTRFEPVEDMMAFTNIKDGFIEYGGSYYGVAIEIPPVEFRFFSRMRRNNTIENAVGKVLRGINPDYAANIVKIERPILYDHYVENEKKKVEEFRDSYENGLITEEELRTRIDILYERMTEYKKFCFEDKIVQPFYYIVLFDSNKKLLNNSVNNALDVLRNGELEPKRLNDKELAVFLKYTNEIDFDERIIDSIDPESYAQWAMPQTIRFKARTTEVNNIITHNMRVANYPNVVGDAWFASLMSIPATKVVVKVKPMDRTKSITAIDRSLQEINDRLNHTGVQSKIIELSSHAETLSELLRTLQGDNELLLNMNVYVTSYDISLTRSSVMPEQPPISLRTSITNMKKTVRRTYSEAKFKLENLDFYQVPFFIASQVSGYDAMAKDGRGIPSNSVAAAYPWIFANVADEKGVKLGYHDGVPVFVDFFRRDSERVNSNMVIVGKSGSGKSYATKSILTNLAGEDTKIFILDPENEYSELAHNLHGKIINVGNASQGRLNPFHIITALDDEIENVGASSSYATHLQFLEEFFKQSLVDCDKDALEYLNALVDRTYMKKGITAETNLSLLKPEDYPIFDDLYDVILSEFQTTDSDYIRGMLRTLMNYISKYSTGGRNASIWNGPSTVTTDENFTVFNFQSMLANRNTTIANSQMLLVLKYIDNEIIKNRDYNTKYHTKRKIAVVIDEAHVFIDSKYPIALDFMFQLAKRIRKYNGMQIVITQNIKDFVGSEELARKSTAIINACQYSFIFALSPNDIDDLCRLYEKSGGINEMEQEQIVNAGRGQAFAIMSSAHRTSFKVEVPNQLVQMFRTKEYKSEIFDTEDGEALWENYIADSRAVREEYDLLHHPVVNDQETDGEKKRSYVTFSEITAEDFAREDTERTMAQARKEAQKEVKAVVKEEYKSTIKMSALDKARNSSGDIFSNIDNLSDDALDEFIESLAAQNHSANEQETFNFIDTPVVVDEQPSNANNITFDEVISADLSETEVSSTPVTNEAFGTASNNVQTPKTIIPRVVNAASNIGIPGGVAVPSIVVQPNQSSEKLDDAIAKLAVAVENMGRVNYESIASIVRDIIGTETISNGNNTQTVTNDRRVNLDSAEDVSSVLESIDDISAHTVDADRDDVSIDDYITQLLGEDFDSEVVASTEPLAETYEDEQVSVDTERTIDDLISEILSGAPVTSGDEVESNSASFDDDIDFDSLLGLNDTYSKSSAVGSFKVDKSPIDDMIENGVPRIVISINELIEYNMKKVNK